MKLLRPHLLTIYTARPHDYRTGRRHVWIDFTVGIFCVLALAFTFVVLLLSGGR